MQGGESVQRSAQASVPRASASAELAYSTPTLIDGLAEEYRAAASERKVEAGDDGVPSYPQVPAHAVTVVETYQPQRVGDEGN